MPARSTTGIAALRALNKSALDSFAKIEAPTRGTSQGGGANTGVRTWETVDGGDAVPCRLGTAGAGSPMIEAAQLAPRGRLVVSMDLDAPDVLQGYRLTVSGRDIAGADWSRVVLVVEAPQRRTSTAMRILMCEDAPPGSR